VVALGGAAVRVPPELDFRHSPSAIYKGFLRAPQIDTKVKS
jgi:hypothetical protein